ncbi:hypothetical protein EJ08DRAFT_701366 [Tothia fuscella]|uniref:Uncharacterized protein n=1 Tax=Tothia fuscella TaxID=1048955 RepID=A0A9P4TUX1_9PEZI|nr:hypothetical protein EJ08DRAFT_701366 [Tothia fuscella]
MLLFRGFTAKEHRHYKRYTKLHHPELDSVDFLVAIRMRGKVGTISHGRRDGYGWRLGAQDATTALMENPVHVREALFEVYEKCEPGKPQNLPLISETPTKHLQHLVTSRTCREEMKKKYWELREHELLEWERKWRSEQDTLFRKYGLQDSCDYPLHPELQP